MLFLIIFRSHHFKIYYENEDEFEDTDLPNIVCAVINVGSKDTYLGNEGFPLQYYNRDHHFMYTMNCIVTHGCSFCGRSAGGTIYTNVY